MAILLNLVDAAGAQSKSQPGQDYQERVTGALSTAKKSADALNEQHKALLAALTRAADGQQAKQVLDELVQSTTTALANFDKDSEVMTIVTSLLAFIDERRKVAEGQVDEQRWRESAQYWRSEGDNIRTLRQDILVQVDRGKIGVEKLKKDRAYIEDVIAREGVDAAKREMAKALQGLKVLGDSIEQAVATTEQRHRTIPGG